MIIRKLGGWQCEVLRIWIDKQGRLQNDTDYLTEAEVSTHYPMIAPLLTLAEPKEFVRINVQIGGASIQLTKMDRQSYEHLDDPLKGKL